MKPIRALRVKAKILWRNRRRRDGLVSDLVFIGGLLIVAGGCGWIYGPAGMIVGGTLFAAIAWHYEPRQPGQPLSPRERELIEHYRSSEPEPEED